VQGLTGERVNLEASYKSTPAVCQIKIKFSDVLAPVEGVNVRTKFPPFWDVYRFSLVTLADDTSEDVTE
jgi:hypothetical protein